jgi:hypothetical protein
MEIKAGCEEKNPERQQFISNAIYSGFIGYEVHNNL